MRTIRHYVDKHALERPDKIFLTAPEPNLEISYARLKESAAEFADFLHGRGARKGDAVGFLLGNSYQSARIIIGAMYAGMVVAPLNLQAQQDVLKYVLDHSDAKLVFTSGEHLARLEKALSEVTRKIEVVVIDPDAEEALPPYCSAPSAPSEPGEEDPALLLYTSGTTGLPKGVVLTHKNMIAGGRCVIEAHDLTENDVALCSLVLYHINALVVSLMSTVVRGASVVVPHGFSKSRFWSLISDYRCTWFSVVPTIISYLHCDTETENKGYHLEQLRFGRSASSALPEHLHRCFEAKFGVGVVETMGLTETAAPILSNPLDPARRKYGSPGRAVGCRVKIRDERGGEASAGEVGEILVRGDNVMKEYYKAPGITAETMGPDGWLCTGDLGYMDEEGFVFVTGRLKELIIKGGENISPREIDDACYKHPAIKDAAAVGIPDEHYGEEIMVCVTLKDGCECTMEDLRAHCENHLNKYKTPKVIKFMEELPKGPSGKIQRLKLRDYR
ncbi:MAG: AMP-binding protein [Desulfobacterales bacterium]|nr:AMP-binding protein [Desulfobacterales bacterium]